MLVTRNRNLLAADVARLGPIARLLVIGTDGTRSVSPAFYDALIVVDPKRDSTCGSLGASMRFTSFRTLGRELQLPRHPIKTAPQITSRTAFSPKLPSSPIRPPARRGLGHRARIVFLTDPPSKNSTTQTSKHLLALHPLSEDTDINDAAVRIKTPNGAKLEPKSNGLARPGDRQTSGTTASFSQLVLSRRAGVESSFRPERAPTRPQKINHTIALCRSYLFDTKAAARVPFYCPSIKNKYARRRPSIRAFFSRRWIGPANAVRRECRTIVCGLFDRRFEAPP
jgi:hypothetical protein